jgi:hypothetical protein
MCQAASFRGKDGEAGAPKKSLTGFLIEDYLREKII